MVGQLLASGDDAEFDFDFIALEPDQRVEPVANPAKQLPVLERRYQVTLPNRVIERAPKHGPPPRL